MIQDDLNSENKLNEIDGVDNSRTVNRRPRALKRKSTRSTQLKRKKTTNTEQFPKPDKGEGFTTMPESKPQKAVAKKAIKKPPTKPIIAKSVKRKKKVTGKVADKRKSTNLPKTVVIENEEYEIKSFPDGTQVKVKTSDHKTNNKNLLLKEQVDPNGDGPGPAFEVYKPMQQPSSDKRVDISSIRGENRRAVAYLKKRLDVMPKVAVILGSGQSSVANLTSAEVIPFSDIPGFKVPSVPGHPGKVRVGMVEGVPTLFCEGRLHYYETGSMSEVTKPLRTFFSLGVEHVVLTTSAGAVNLDYKVGDVMFVRDHINLMGDNPIFGLDSKTRFTSFVDVSNVYSSRINEMTDRLCRRARIKSHLGVLAGMRGPVYETPAEISWLRKIGVDAVCMSLIPEVLAAAHVNARVTALALIVNSASDRGDSPPDHSRVVKAGNASTTGLKRIIRSLLPLI
ncbi:MAG TPA: purine-nucleoside phosphorylase [Nitrospinota bacterium]|nr:purine-nucleoside phosphorylase [Nitrospinota bacterium]|tara:strand:+ start:30786 stop:32141 length:1356 start_codon:yes stop_codon:yes gene_type:complete